MNKLGSEIQSGILLLELLVYLAISMLMSTLLATFYLQVQRTIDQCQHMGLYNMHCCAALDLLQHEIQQAPGCCRNWYVRHDDTLIWKGYDGKDHGIVVMQCKLSKITGMYDSIGQRWTERSMVPLVEDVASFKVSYEYDKAHEYIVVISMVFTVSTHPERQWHIKTVLVNRAYQAPCSYSCSWL